MNFDIDDVKSVLEESELEEQEFKQTQYTIYQLKIDENIDRNLSFCSFGFLKNGEKDIQISNYEKVYTGNMKSIDISSKEEILDICERIYTIFNTEEMPNDFEGHSLSVSDVIVIECNGKSKAYYCDSIGFKEIPTFIEQIKAEKINNLAANLVDYLKDIDFYNYQDNMELDDTDADIIKNIEIELGDKKYCEGVIKYLEEQIEEQTYDENVNKENINLVTKLCNEVKEHMNTLSELQINNNIEKDITDEM